MFYSLVLSAVLLCLVLVYDLVRKSGRAWRLLEKFPGDYPLPFIGNALQIGFNTDETCKRLMDLFYKHGMQNFRVTLGMENWILLSDPDDVKIILSHPNELSKPIERNAAMLKFFGNSVSTSEGEKWRTTRKLMVSSFHYRSLEQKLEALNTNCDRLLNILEERRGRGLVDMYRYLKPYMMDIVCDTFMGVDLNFLENPDHPYFDTGRNVIALLTSNYFSHWRTIDPLFSLTQRYRDMTEAVKNIRDVSDMLITKSKERLKEMRSSNRDEKLKKERDGLCLLDKFLLSRLPNGEPIPEEMINDEISLFCYTAHYTTTITMSHALYYIAKYHRIQKELVDEQLNIFMDDRLRKPTLDDLNKMKYLEAVVKETLRMVPTVSKIGRQIHQDLVLSDGRIVPAGSTVLVLNKALHMNPALFPDPHTFYPERFCGQNKPYSSVPFSAGPRNCIGSGYAWLAMKTTLSNLLRRFQINEGIEPKFAYRMLSESRNGVQIMLSKRHLE
uniref:Cytochrome P450 CYP405A3 n=1 Tax=Zygaena filipendulae TaxID=287375 RepID=D2JLJ9_9NEOP|nr:cytochrome P450 CYP405A3 [Zygaena filipendulae]